MESQIARSIDREKRREETSRPRRVVFLFFLLLSHMKKKEIIRRLRIVTPEHITSFSFCFFFFFISRSCFPTPSTARRKKIGCRILRTDRQTRKKEHIQPACIEREYATQRDSKRHPTRPPCRDHRLLSHAKCISG